LDVTSPKVSAPFFN
jgi:hypothetical protein